MSGVGLWGTLLWQPSPTYGERSPAPLEQEGGLWSTAPQPRSCGNAARKGTRGVAGAQRRWKEAGWGSRPPAFSVPAFAEPQRNSDAARADSRWLLTAGRAQVSQERGCAPPSHPRSPSQTRCLDPASRREGRTPPREPQSGTSSSGLTPRWSSARRCGVRRPWVRAAELPRTQAGDWSCIRATLALWTRSIWLPTCTPPGGGRSIGF